MNRHPDLPSAPERGRFTVTMGVLVLAAALGYSVGLQQRIGPPGIHLPAPHEDEYPPASQVPAARVAFVPAADTTGAR